MLLPRANSRKSVCLLTAIFFCLSLILPQFSTLAYAPITPVAGLPGPGQMVTLSSQYSFPVLKGIKIDPKNPLNITFIIDPADQGKVSDEEAYRIIRYFLAGLTIPESDLWVNLSPYEQDRIVPQGLSDTDLGKDMLSQDYFLKQLSASMTYPESDTGKNYWQEIYSQVAKLGNMSKVPLSTYNKIWIMPDTAEVYEHQDTAVIAQASLKAMLETDYLAMQKNEGQGNSDIASKIMKEMILPKINADVNSGKNFAQLRQMYYSLVLATWFKKKFQDSFYKNYINQKKVSGIDLADKSSKDKIYSLYCEAFKKGVYNYIKKDSTTAGKTVYRKYFSGGVQLVPKTIGDKEVTESQERALLGPTDEVFVTAPESMIPPANSIIADKQMQDSLDKPLLEKRRSPIGENPKGVRGTNNNFNPIRGIDDAAGGRKPDTAGLDADKGHLDNYLEILQDPNKPYGKAFQGIFEIVENRSDLITQDTLRVLLKEVDGLHYLDPAAEVIAKIAEKRPELINSNIIAAFEDVLKYGDTNSSYEFTHYTYAAYAIEAIAKTRPDLLSQNTMVALENVLKIPGLYARPDTDDPFCDESRDASAKAIMAIAEKRPNLINQNIIEALETSQKINFGDSFIVAEALKIITKETQKSSSEIVLSKEFTINTKEKKFDVVVEPYQVQFYHYLGILENPQRLTFYDFEQSVSGIVNIAYKQPEFDRQTITVLENLLKRSDLPKHYFYNLLSRMISDFIEIRPELITKNTVVALETLLKTPGLVAEDDSFFDSYGPAADAIAVIVEKRPDLISKDTIPALGTVLKLPYLNDYGYSSPNSSIDVCEGYVSAAKAIVAIVKKRLDLGRYAIPALETILKTHETTHYAYGEAAKAIAAIAQIRPELISQNTMTRGDKMMDLRVRYEKLLTSLKEIPDTLWEDATWSNNPEYDAIKSQMKEIEAQLDDFSKGGVELVDIANIAERKENISPYKDIVIELLAASKGSSSGVKKVLHESFILEIAKANGASATSFAEVKKDLEKAGMVFDEAPKAGAGFWYVDVIGGPSGARSPEITSGIDVSPEKFSQALNVIKRQMNITGITVKQTDKNGIIEFEVYPDPGYRTSIPKDRLDDLMAYFPNWFLKDFATVKLVYIKDSLAKITITPKPGLLITSSGYGQANLKNNDQPPTISNGIDVKDHRFSKDQILWAAQMYGKSNLSFTAKTIFEYLLNDSETPIYTETGPQTAWDYVERKLLQLSQADSQLVKSTVTGLWMYKPTTGAMAGGEGSGRTMNQQIADMNSDAVSEKARRMAVERSDNGQASTGGIDVRDIERDLKVGVSPNSLPMELPNIGPDFFQHYNLKIIKREEIGR